MNKCGQPTKSGRACSRPRSKGKLTCSQHAHGLVSRMSEPVCVEEVKALSELKSQSRSTKTTTHKKPSRKKSTKQEPKTTRRPTLKEFLSIYKYEFLGPWALDFVQKHETSSLKDTAKHLTIVYPKTLNSKDVKEHYKYRHPIHIGGPKYVDIHMAQMQKILGYTQSDAERVDRKTNALMRYGILAPSILNKQLTSMDKCWFLHLWGVNMESLTTTDAKYVCNGRGPFDSNKYKHLLDIFFNIVGGACDALHEYTSKGIIVLRISKLGFGAWATMIPSDQKTPLIDYYLEQLYKIVSTRRWLQIRFPNYPSHKTFIIDHSTQNLEAEPNHDPFGAPLEYQKQEGYIRYPKNSTLLIVNAWDDRSFIGNGGSQDNTLDGWVVDGGGKYFSKSEFYEPNAKEPMKMGKSYVNVSILHNAAFYDVDKLKMFPV